jgi:hypothetical protein
MVRRLLFSQQHSDSVERSARTLAQGLAGNLQVTASESVEVIGRGADGLPSLLTAETRTAYDAKDLTIKTGQLTVRDGAQVTVSSTGSGRAGSLRVNADSIF